MLFLAVALPLLFTSACGLMSGISTQIDPDLTKTDAQKVEINLDLPPEDRWNDILQVHRETILRWAKTCPQVLDKYGRDLADRWMKAQWIPEDYKREMQGMVKAVDDPSFTYECVFMQNLLYDDSFDNKLEIPEPQVPQQPHMCSSVLAAMPNGTVIHARNADWVHKYGTTAYGSFDVTAMRGGKPVWQSMMSLPMNGMHSGMTFGPGAWTIAQNTRAAYGLDREKNVAWAEQGGHTSFLISRYLMEQGLSYSEALGKLASMKWNSPQYLIMAGAGPWEGAVITIDPELSYQNVAVLNSHNRPVMYQLNSDNWLSPRDPRDGVVLQFEGRPHEINVESMWNLITSEPVLYNSQNVFTYVAVPATGYWRLIVHPEGSLQQQIELKAEE